MNKAQPRVTLIHWNIVEGRERARILRKAKLQVKLEGKERDGQAVYRRLREAPPDAIVIDLSCLPSHGRDLGVARRTAKQTRKVPLVFVEGEPAKVDRVLQMLPDAAFASWATAGAAVRRALASRSPDPFVPSSNLAGYSGTPLPKKLGIKANSAVALLDPPEAFVEGLGELPAGVEFHDRLLPRSELAIWFVRSAAELSSRVDTVAKALGAARLWICWAKRTSPLATDVNEPAVRTAGLAAGLVDYKVAAIDGDWSGLLFAPRRENRVSRKSGR